MTDSTGSTGESRPPDDRPPEEHEFYDRRSGGDRRGGGERRRGGRRYRRVDIAEERRSGEDRRRAPRRRLKDRRRFVDPRYKKEFPKPGRPVYSTEEVARVQHMLAHVGHGTTCPACEGTFTLGSVDRRGLDTVRQVWCAKCGRGTVVTNCILARIMVLSRVQAMSDTLRKILTSAGHEVLEPPHTGAALEVYRDNPADVVFMDSSALEHIEGPEFIRRLRKDFPDPRIVVVTPRLSSGMPDPTATATRLGATHVVRTPFTPDDILQALKASRG